MKVVFMGTPDFAVPSLTNIIAAPELEVVGVVTQPDRPKGRGNKLGSSPVKQAAQKNGLEVFQPESVNTPEAYSKLREWAPEVIVVVAFGQILKEHILQLPKFGCINVHASLLPQYRGAAPIHWAIINGETKTGISTMYMEQGLDTGDIILQEEVAIGPEETTGELHDRLSLLGGNLIVATLRMVREGKAPRRKQEDSKATYAPVLKREHEVIDWKQDAAGIVNQIRGLNPWPGSFTTLRGKTLKLWRARVLDYGDICQSDAVPGQVVDTGKKGIIVQAGKGQVAITELQLQSRSKMRVEEFLRGNNLQPGEILGGVSPDA